MTVSEARIFLLNLKQIQPKHFSAELTKLILENVPQSDNFHESIYLFIHDLVEIPTCGYRGCTYKKRFISMAKGYQTGCCRDHSTRLSNIEKYGVENQQQSSEIKAKTIKTNLKKYGVENPAQSEEIKTKTRCKYFEKTGFNSPLENPSIIEKIQATNLKRFGYSNPLKQGSESRKKFKSTMLEKYGCVSALQSDEIKEKYKQRLMNKHGVTHHNKIAANLIKTRINYFNNKLKSSDYPVVPLFDENEYADLTKFKEFKWQCKTCSNIFMAHNENKVVPRCFKCYPSIKVGVSAMETELVDYVKTVLPSNIDVLTNYRRLIEKAEVDIYIPSKNIAIEFNGIYWHSELNGKDKNYHLGKTERCSEKGIQLILVFESEWLEKKEIVKSIISSKLGIFENRIYARNCKIMLIDNTAKRAFLESNHIQGDDNSSVKLGLFYNDELISIMTFGHSRYNQNYQYEMHRFCSKIGYQIVGGASKLWKYFLNNYNPESVITYADRRYSNGEFYEKIGFERIGISKPNYFYRNSSGQLFSRLKFQKHKLEKILPEFSSTLSEWENMQIAGYDRIWDCGNYVFEFKESK